MYFEPRHYGFRPLPARPPGAAPDPVVVVGAGPVGLAAALGLARRGVPVTVLEAGSSVSHGSRAICLSRHSLEILERLGAGAQFAEKALPWTRGRSHYRDQEVLAFEMPHDDGAARPPMVNISQSVAEQVLVDAAEATPGCDIHWRTEVTGCTPHKDHVAVEYDTPEGPGSLRARHVVAADGARSAVRHALGLQLAGTSYEGRYVIADIHWKSPLPTERRVWFDPPSNPGSTVILHRQPDDIWRIDYQLRPGDDPDAETGEDRVRARVTEHLDWLGNTAPWTLEWASLYRAHSLSLDSYVHGRVLFAGDAAHLVPIFGVRGLNSGLEDADQLSWMLAAVHHGAAGDALLGTYAAERRAAWEQNVAQAGKSTRFMTPGTTGYRTTRDAVLALAARRPVLRHLIDPRQSSATHARTSTLTLAADTAGALLPGDPVRDRAVTADGTETSLNALRGGDFTLLQFAPDTADQQVLAETAATLGAALAPAVGVRALAADAPGPAHPGIPQITGTAGPLAADLGAHAGDTLVIRPDGLLLARLTGRPDAAALAERIRTGGTR